MLTAPGGRLTSRERDLLGNTPALPGGRLAVLGGPRTLRSVQGGGQPGIEPAVDLQGAVGGDLPLTGFALIAAMVLLGLWLLSAGAVLRSLPSQD